MDKKKWIPAKITNLGFENTEATWKQVDNHDNVWVSVEGHWLRKHS